MKIYIVRHGETDSNKAKKLMGQRIDGDLNSEGIKQSNKIAQSLSEKGFDIIFTSPLKRAVQTARIIANRINIPVIKKDEILERDFGSFSGKSWEEMIKEIGSTNVNFREKDLEQNYDYRPYGGECVDDVKKRFLKFIEEIKENYSGKKILIVAHGGILKLAHFLFLEKKPTHTPNNAVIQEFDI